MIMLTLAHADPRASVVRAAVPEQAIKHVLVIDLENEDYADTYGPKSPAVYLNSILLKQGQLVSNYFATSHASLGNYLSQVSGQQSTAAQNDDCPDLVSLPQPSPLGGFTDVTPGGDASDQVRFPGQVLGDGCVFPAPSKTARGVRTIADQLDAQYPQAHRLNWRGYAEDMGNDLARDYGTPDALGGADCAHPPIGGLDHSNDATAIDQYATRHNPFVYFHSIIDDVSRCNRHVVPLGTLKVGRNGAADTFQGHLYDDLRRLETTPRFMFVSPNLCNDGHDDPCVAPNVEGRRDAAGRNVGGLVSADLWLRHWMPMILASPAYQSGTLLVVLTFDEAGMSDSRACEKINQADCHSPVGPNNSNPGFSSLSAVEGQQQTPTQPYVYPGGGQVGAVLLNKRYIRPGTVNNTGSYNHYSALRSYEDLLGLTSGGDDGLGHLGYAAAPGLQPFGADVFNRR
jgi:hypothetical protein